MTELQPLVCDISHNNPAPTNLQQARDQAGVYGIIAKASQGIHRVDPMYESTVAACTAASMLQGAYHFGTGDDPVQQAMHFLNTVRPQEGTLLALDFETNTTRGETTMSLDQAAAFIDALTDAGHDCCLYSGSSFLATALNGAHSNALAACKLWIARYGSIQPTWPLYMWPDGWSLWQYTSRGNIPGIGNPVDVSRFNGTLDALRDFWHS